MKISGCVGQWGWWGWWLLNVCDIFKQAHIWNTFFPQDIQCIAIPRGRQQSLNSGISWTQHWRFGLCLHKRKGRHCKLFTGERRVTASCVCVRMCLQCNIVAFVMGWLLSDWDRINIETVACVYTQTHTHTCCLQLGKARHWHWSTQKCIQQYTHDREL